MQKHVNLVDLVKELANAYVLAKVGVDTEEHEPPNVCSVG